MNSIMARCDAVIKKLEEFPACEMGEAVPGEWLELFEKHIGFTLPAELTYILEQHNGLAFEGTCIYSLDAAAKGSSLDRVYAFEHETVAHPMPLHFLPFSPDGFGNHYCLDLSANRDGICPVVFWQHDFPYATWADVEISHDCLADWIEEVMIEWNIDS